MKRTVGENHRKLATMEAKLDQVIDVLLKVNGFKEPGDELTETQV